MRNATALALLLALTCCVTSADVRREMETWIGQTTDALVLAYGEPAAQQPWDGVTKWEPQTHAQWRGLTRWVYVYYRETTTPGYAVTTHYGYGVYGSVVQPARRHVSRVYRFYFVDEHGTIVRVGHWGV